MQLTLLGGSFQGALFFFLVGEGDITSQCSPFLCFKAGVNRKPVFPPVNLGLMRISHSRFKHFLKPSAHFLKLCLAVFCKCLGRNSFSQRISKIWRNKKY